MADWLTDLRKLQKSLGGIPGQRVQPIPRQDLRAGNTPALSKPPGAPFPPGQTPGASANLPFTGKPFRQPPAEDPMAAIRRALGANGLPPGRANLGGGGGMPGGGAPPIGAPQLPMPSPGGGGGLAPPGGGGGPPIPPTMPRGPLPGGRPMPPWMGVPAAGAAMIGAHALTGNRDPMMGAPSSGTLGPPGGGQTPSPLSDSLNMNPGAGAPPRGGNMPIPKEPAGPSGAGMPPPGMPAAPKPPDPGLGEMDQQKLGAPPVPMPRPRPPMPMGGQHIPTPAPRPQMPIKAPMNITPQQHQEVLKFLMGPRDFRGQTYQPPWEAGLPESYKR